MLLRVSLVDECCMGEHSDRPSSCTPTPSCGNVLKAPHTSETLEGLPLSEKLAKGLSRGGKGEVQPVRKGHG